MSEYSDKLKGFGVGGINQTHKKKTLVEWRCPQCQITVERWRSQCVCGQPRTNSYGDA